MSYYTCQIRGCTARLLGFEYWTYILDNGRAISTCRSCSREINKARKQRRTHDGQEHMDTMHANLRTR